MTESFPRQQARTRRFTLGAPRSHRISPDGARIVFLRSKGGGDPVTCLWQLDVNRRTERLIADPAALNATDEDLPPEERARRERAREQAGGVVSYAADRDLRTVVFSLSGRVFTADLTAADGSPEAAPRELSVQTPARVRSGWSRTRGRWAAASRTCRRRNGPAGSGSGSRPAASWRTPRTRT